MVGAVHALLFLQLSNGISNYHACGWRNDRPAAAILLVRSNGLNLLPVPASWPRPQLADSDTKAFCLSAKTGLKSSSDWFWVQNMTASDESDWIVISRGMTMQSRGWLLNYEKGFRFGQFMCNGRVVRVKWRSYTVDKMWQKEINADPEKDKKVIFHHHCFEWSAEDHDLRNYWSAESQSALPFPFTFNHTCVRQSPYFSK